MAKRRTTRPRGGRLDRADTEAFMAAVVESSEDAIIGKGVDGIISSWNPGATRLYGYEASEVVGKSITMLVPVGERPRHAEIMKRVGNGERIPPFQARRLRKSGEFIDVALSLSPVRDGGDRDAPIIAIAEIAHDVTNERRLEAHLRQSQKMEAIGRLAGGVAHDFNNLITVISGYSDILLFDGGASKETRGLLHEIKKAGDRAAALTRQLLAFSRKTVLESKVFEVNLVVRECERMLRRVVGEDLELHCELGSDAGRVHADPGQFENSLVNLAVNARDAMPRGGMLTIETSVVTLDPTYCAKNEEVVPGRYVLIAVTDNGAGMDAATQARAFEPFFTTKASGQGTGLGLAMVYGFVKQSGGHVTLYSEIGSGSTFKIYLPQVESPTSTIKADVPSDAMPRGTETILLVEDDEGVRSLAKHTLAACGYEVLEAAHGGEAIDIAERHLGPIHLVASDVVMPKVDGRTAVEKLTAHRPTIKTLFLSGYTDDTVIRHGILDADVNFLPKPYSPHSLAKKIRDVLDQ